MMGRMDKQEDAPRYKAGSEKTDEPRAIFFSNVRDYSDLRNRSGIYYGFEEKYHVIGHVELSREEWTYFSGNMLVGFQFLWPYIHCTVVLQHVWQVVEVCCGPVGVLVMMDGYEYPRYVAMIPKAK